MLLLFIILIINHNAIGDSKTTIPSTALHARRSPTQHASIKLEVSKIQSITRITANLLEFLDAIICCD